MIQVIIPHRALASANECHDYRDLLPRAERDDCYAVHDFDSLADALAWSADYTGHQHLRVQAALEELAR